MRTMLTALFTLSAAGAWTVCLDPGHGGTDPGASGSWYLEKEANLDVAFAAAAYLEQVPDCDWIGMTRTGDYTVSLAARVDYANTNGFDRFMSVHENAYNTYVQGSETFCYSLDPSTPGYDLASKVLDGILWAHSYNDRGVKDGSWIYVVANTTMPAILGEGSFIDYDDLWNESYRYCTNWNDHSGRQGYAYALGICQHMGSDPPPYGSGELIIDNLSPGFSVNDEDQWATGSYGEPWGPDYRWSSTTNQADWARWTPNIPDPGWYNVHIWYTEGSNRAPDAVFTVTHAEGETGFTVDQTTGGGQWNLLGGFPFDAGTAGWVTLSENGTEPGNVVIADAVRFQMVSTSTGEGSFGALSDRPALSVFPNPGRSFTVRLSATESEMINISVHDITGRVVETLCTAGLEAGSGTISWNPSRLPAGVYVIHASSPEWSATRRIVLTVD